MNDKQLTVLCKHNGITGYSRMKKQQKIDALNALDVSLEASTKVEDKVEDKAPAVETKVEAPVEAEVEPVTKPVKEKKPRKANAWHGYVKQYAADNGLTYGKAMQAARPSWAEKKELMTKQKSSESQSDE
jgi:hypothetical protein